jgi:PhnB protein
MNKHSEGNNAVHFAPILYLHDGAAAIEFYTKAFNAKELRRFSNDDGSVHVAELTIGDALFRLHEETGRSNELSPHTVKGTTVVLGLFVDDPDAIMEQALAAGATTITPMQDYDYGYRQGNIADPFGHHWTIEKQI